MGEGELLTVVGPSGSGKSTLLRAIAGLEPLDAGRVVVGGDDVTGRPPARRGVAMVFQSFALFPHLDVARNIAFGLEARRVPGARRRELVGDVAARLGVEALLDRRPSALSGGERQRVALARGLVGRPRVLLLDEPLSNLDAQLRAQARAEIRDVQAQEGVAMVHVTHDQAEALALGHRVAVLNGGRLVQAGPPADVYARPVDTFVAGFLGSPPMNVLPGRAIPALGADERVLVGFRPEDVIVGDGSGAFPVRVELVERAGADVVWRLSCAGVRFAARPPLALADAACAGDEVRVAVPVAALRRFDPATGEAVDP